MRSTTGCRSTNALLVLTDPVPEISAPRTKTRALLVPTPIAAAFLSFTSIVACSEAFGDTSGCSLEAFPAYGQTWSGIPVLPNVIVAESFSDLMDSSSCGYMAAVKLTAAEEWYEQQMADIGWELVSRKKEDVATVLSFRREAEALTVSLQPSDAAVIVLLVRPKPDERTEPTR